jgi:hypothetical protein
MSNGLGAGFAALSILAALSGLALLVVLSTAASLAFHRRTGRIPSVLRYLPVASLVGVLAIGGFGTLAFYDEALVVSGLLVALVFIPLVAAGASIRRSPGMGRLDAVAATAMAWSGPFLVGVATVIGLLVTITEAFGLGTAAPERLTVAWIAVTGGGSAAVVGTLLVGDRIAGVVSSAT